MKRRWLKWGLIGLGALLLILIALLFWLGGTGSGLRFVLGRTVVALDDKLSYGSADGSLFGGMILRDVRYHDPAVGDYRVARVEIAPRSRRLLTGTLHLTGLSLDDVRIALPPPDPDEPPADEPFELPAVVAPLSMRIDRLVVDGVDVRDHADTPVLRLNRIEGAAGWRGTVFAIDRLAFDAPEGDVALRADIDTGRDWAGDADAEFRWQMPDQPQLLAGRLRLQGPQRQPSLHLDLVEPSAALIDLSWARDSGTPHWQLSARSDAFDLGALVPDEPPVRRLTFDLHGTGTPNTATLKGRVVLDDYAVLIETFSGSYRDATLVVDGMALAEADGPGRLQGSARIDLSSDTATGEIDAQWQAINPPLEAPFDRLDANGTITANGSLERLVADIRANATVDQQPVQLAVHAEGAPHEDLRFAPLTLTTGRGRLNADGTLRLEPALAWDAKIEARDFNPGLLLPDWSGRVELDARTQGERTGDDLAARVDIERIGGQLKNRPLGGSGHVTTANGKRIDADLNLKLGDTTIDVEGQFGDSYDARVRFDIDDAGLLLPDAEGRASGDVALRGQWPALSVAGTVTGNAIAVNDIRIGTLEIDADLRTDLASDGRIEIDARDLSVAGESIQRLWLEGRGDAAANQLRLDADAERGQAVLAMTGRYDADAQSWSGRLDTLELASPDLPAPLALGESAALTLAADRIDIERACLSAEASALCVDGQWRNGEGGDAGFELTRLPLAWLTALGEADMLIADGELGGRGRFRLDADNTLTGQAQIEGTPGRLRLSETDDDMRDLAAWTRLVTTVELAGEHRALSTDIELSPAGYLRAEAETRPRDDAAESLSGTVDLNLPDLSFIELFSPDIVQPTGELRGRIDLAGTLETPRVNGDIGLNGFRAELPALGLKLRDSTVSLRASQGDRIDIDGRIATAENSTLVIGGWVGLPNQGRLPMDVRITGEDVLIADIPAARVFVTPDLTITATDERLDVNGEVGVPQARIFPERIEGGATAVSPDVHIVDPEAQAESAAAEQAALPIHATVAVRLGDRVHIDGYGLKGRLSGQLEVRERPNRPTTGRGEIVVTGTYQAYGQDLDIERGRLIFTGTPVDNPSLDIRAIRKVEAVTAGLVVTGNALRPVLEVYSVPAMDQAEALSYLVLGRPLRQATSSEDQTALGTAATAVSTAGGDLLAKSLGTRLGLDEVGVGTSRELGAGALTVGKYLSPRLYLGYGRSLFDGSQLVSLRYRLSERFELEAQSGTRENKAGINYRYER